MDVEVNSANLFLQYSKLLVRYSIFSKPLGGTAKRNDERGEKRGHALRFA